MGEREQSQVHPYNGDLNTYCEQPLNSLPEHDREILRDDTKPGQWTRSVALTLDALSLL
jgi:hypothetical protein